MSWIASGEAGPGDELAERIRERLERRLAADVSSRSEIERVSRMPVRLFDPGGAASEAFRRLCVVSRIDAPVTLQSHRPLIGRSLVAMKRVVARLLRFHVEVPLARQAEFNRNLLVVIQELFDRLPPRDEGSSKPS